MLWGFWLFFAICGHYALILPRRDVVTGSAITATIVGIAGLLIFSWLLIRGLVSKESREELLAKRAGLPEASIAFRILVWTIPALGLGALLAPVLIR